MPMRANIANKAVPFLGTPRVAADARKSSNAYARCETHFVVIVLLDDRVRAAQLPHLILILHRDAAREILAGKARRHCLCHETIETYRLPKPETGVCPNAAIVE